MWRSNPTVNAVQSRPRPEPARPGPRPAGEAPNCCGQPMQPQLAHARDGYGHSLFVTLWRCSQCGKSVD